MRVKVLHETKFRNYHYSPNLNSILSSTSEKSIRKKHKIVEKIKSMNPDKLRKAGKIALGVAATAGLTYGGVKAYQHFKNRKKKK